MHSNRGSKIVTKYPTTACLRVRVRNCGFKDDSMSCLPFMTLESALYGPKRQTFLLATHDFVPRAPSSVHSKRHIKYAGPVWFRVSYDYLPTLLAVAGQLLYNW